MKTVRVHFQLREKGQAPAEENIGKLYSEDFDSDEELALAVASQLLEMITDLREIQSLREDEDDEDY